MLILFSLIVMRMTGAIALNPEFGRSNVPRSVRGAFIFMLSLMLYVGTGANLVHEPAAMLEYSVMLLKELLFGFALGFGMELSFMVVRFASSVMDYSMGLSMAQIYDFEHGTQMTITSGLYYAFMVLLFFATNGHLRLMGIFYSSSVLVPFGQVVYRPELSQAILNIFSECILMGLQFAFPLLAMELVSEAAMGILMRVIPQINVFAVNFQLKIIVGLIMLVLLFSPMSDKVYSVLNEMYLSLQHLVTLMA